MEAQLDSALNLMRRMPPSSTENSLSGLIEMVPELTDDLLTQVDQPLKVMKDEKKGRKFVICDYNRDGDSYRSPWSNEYFPAFQDGFLPNKKLRDMEVEANDLFDVYRKLYFEGGYSSAYFFDTDENENSDNFGACFLIHKDVESQKSLQKGWWDSIHVFEVNKDPNGDGEEYVYKLTTTVMVSLVLTDDKIGKVDLSGLRTSQDSRRVKLGPETGHIANMGKMLEDMELRIRNAIENIYIEKTRTVTNGMRSATSQRDAEWGNIAKSLNAAVFHHKNKTANS